MAKFWCPLAQYCATHKPADYVNVKSKICEFIGCNKQPTPMAPLVFARQYCANHKPDEFILLYRSNENEINAASILMTLVENH